MRSPQGFQIHVVAQGHMFCLCGGATRNTSPTERWHRLETASSEGDNVVLSHLKSELMWRQRTWPSIQHTTFQCRENQHSCLKDDVSWHCGHDARSPKVKGQSYSECTVNMGLTGSLPRTMAEFQPRDIQNSGQKWEWWPLSNVFGCFVEINSLAEWNGGG